MHFSSAFEALHLIFAIMHLEFVMSKFDPGLTQYPGSTPGSSFSSRTLTGCASRWRTSYGQRLQCNGPQALIPQRLQQQLGHQQQRPPNEGAPHQRGGHSDEVFRGDRKGLKASDVFVTSLIYLYPSNFDQGMLASLRQC